VMTLMTTECRPKTLLMLKAPVEGEVKTRLGRTIGGAAAVRAYRQLVEHQVRCIPSGWRVQVRHAPDEAGEVMRGWLGVAMEYSPQGSGDLGARLARAAEEHFAGGNAPLIFIGGDCPYLSSSLLLEVEEMLREADAAIVPALDGGYCLLGIRGAERELFTDIPWSTERVMEMTRERLRACGWRWKETAPAEDVDDEGSWRRAVEAFPKLEGEEI